jgi:serine/threonine-protein kinase
MARFDREAKTLASLHHPNVASLFGFEESGGTHFLVMELVEGEELAARIERGPIPPEEVAAIARQIALGLEAAHDRGITHRDLKPSNVRITPTGEVKILDFGLARAGSPDDPGGDPAASPTITAAMTRQGVILGTAAYMSPEQARGQSVDTRSDIWAFGVLLWEMLHGRRLFDGGTMSDTLAGVLKNEIDCTDLPPGTPRSMQRVLQRCLQRDPRQRLHSIADARIELETPSGVVEPPRAGAGSGRLPWILVALLIAAVGTLLVLRPAGRPSEPVSASVSVLMPEGSEIILGDWPAMAVSPDGSAVAVTGGVDGRPTILVRPLAERGFRALTEDTDALSPFFSPDGRWIGFFQGGMIRKVSIAGGSPVDLAAMSHPRGMSWCDDGYIYFVPSYATGIHRTRDTGGAAVEVVTRIDTTTTERTHRWPCALPGGRGVVFTSEGSDSPGDYEDAEILFWDAEQDVVRPLGVQGAMARYARTGYLIVARRGTLYAYPFDATSGTVQGGATPVHDGIAGDTASGLYSFDLTDGGDLFFLEAREGESRRTLAWVDRRGSVEPIALPPGPYRYPQIDPTGRRVALVLGEGHGGNDDIYLLDLAGLDLTRFTFDRGSIMPKWSADGRSIYFLSVVEGGSVKQRPADGSRAAETAVAKRGLNILGSISVPEERAFYTRIGGTRLGAITTSLLRPDADIEVAIDTPAAEWAPAISPDGKWLAYVSDESGREEIYVQPWPLTGAKYQVSREGGRAPLWSRDGTELFFSLFDRMYRTGVDTTAGFRTSRPELLFRLPMDNSGTPMSNYDITADGERFLIVEPDQSRLSTVVHVELGFGRVLARIP